MNRTNLTRLILALTACLLLVITAGCASGPNVTPLEGQEREQVLAKAEPIADRFFKSMNEHTYATTAVDLNAEMQKAFTEAAFTQMTQRIDEKVGKNVSRQVSKIEKVGKFYAVTYSVNHEKEQVIWRLVLTQSDPMQLSGLWYDSPSLRSK